MESGWIKLHRKLLENPISRSANYAWLWIVLLLKASHKKQTFMWNGHLIMIKEGQLLTGRKQLSKEVGVSETTIERILNYLESEHQIGQQKTSKYRIITIVNWKDYQNSDIKTDNRKTTERQQKDTYKNDKNVKNDKKDSIASPSDAEAVVKVIHSFKWNPAHRGWYAIKAQRSAAQELLKICPAEKLIKFIGILPEAIKHKYAPVSTTPLQLLNNWSRWEAHFAKEGKNKNVIGIAI